MTTRKHIPDPIKRASRAFGYAVWLDTPDNWHGLTIVLTARLTVEQRGALAWATLRALPDHVADLVRQSGSGVGGYPIPPFDPNGIMDAATWHASVSSPIERKAYGTAHFQAMNSADQRAFLAWANGGMAA